MNKTHLDLDKCNLDSITLNYLKQISGKEAQEALDSWLTYTGWIFSGTEGQKGIQTSIEDRLRKAKKNAHGFSARKKSIAKLK